MIKYKKAKVIMLPTKDESHIIKLNRGLVCYYFPEPQIAKKGHHTAQHLYFTVDEEIKEGDWFYSRGQIRICQEVDIENNEIIAEGSGDYIFILDQSTKIVATTDTSLKIVLDDNCPVCNNTRRIVSSSMKSGFQECGCTKSLPSPSPAFIKKYCELGDIDEVLLECGGSVTEFQNFCSDLGFSYDSTFGWYENTNPGHRPNTSTLEEKFNNKLKVDPIHNTVTLHSVKNNWTREEVECLVKKSFMEGFSSSLEGYCDTAEEFIKQNL